VRFKHPAWIRVARLLSLGNIIAVWFAAQPGEPLHATIHAVLAVLFGLGAQRLAWRRKAAADAGESERSGAFEDQHAELDKVQDLEGRLADLEERLDFTERALVDVRSRAQRPPQE